MSNVSISPSEFDFWEFVSCAKCQLPFVTKSGPAVPFWLTECGHIVCNNHLNHDQTCAQCGANGIQLVPLQREMDAPMCEWFRAVPEALDAVASAAKFQQETMAAQIRVFKLRHQQQRNFIERLKHDLSELKKLNEALGTENGQLREYIENRQHSNHKVQDQFPSTVVNSNGKRQMIEVRTNSSPRSIMTPLGPNRLTLPPGQHTPNFTSNGQNRNAGESIVHASQDPYQGQQRPATNQLIQQYAYIPTSTPQYHSQQPSHNQTAPPNFFQPAAVNSEHRQTSSDDQGQRAMLPPPPSSARFKPAQNSSAPSQNANTHSVQNRAMQNRRIMGPPPTPQHVRQHQVSTSGPAKNNGSNALSAANRFVSPAQPFAPPGSSAMQNQHFMPLAPPTSSSRRFVVAGGSMDATRAPAKPASGSGSRAPSRALTLNRSRSTSQRMPFVPGAQGGFG